MPAELSFDVDGFGNAKVYSENEAIAHILYNLITMPKNHDPLNPDKGVDVTSYISSIHDDGTIAEIKQEVTQQISLYTTYVPTDIAVIIKNKNIVIGITLEGSTDVFYFASDGAKTQLDILKDY